LELEENEPISRNTEAKPKEDHSPVSKEFYNRIADKPKEVIILL